MYNIYIYIIIYNDMSMHVNNIYIYIYVHICMHIARLSLSTYISHVGCMHDMCIYIYVHMYQSSIGEDHSQCNIPLAITGDVDPRPLQVLLFHVAAGFGDLSLNLIYGDHPLTGKPWLMNLRSSTWGMAGYGLPSGKPT